jgi:putative MFS transporter
MDRARKSLKALTGKAVTEPLPEVVAPPRVRLTDLLRYPRQVGFVIIAFLGTGLAAYSILLWGPIIVANVLSISAHEAAGYFIYVMLAGLAGRMVFTIVPGFVGRRRTGEIIGYCAAITLAAAAFLHGGIVFGLPVFLFFVVLAQFFFEGGFANMLPYATEIFPVNLAASGTGLSQATLGLARIASPLMLSFFAGGGAAISPAVMKTVIIPLLISMAVCALFVGLAFTVLGVETRGKAPVKVV